MNAAVVAMKDWSRDVGAAWNRFWFTPAQPHTLALLRILTGAMLFYTHLAWSLHLGAFLGPQSWVNQDAWRMLRRDASTWTWWWVESPALMWLLHVAALVVFALLTVGLLTRVVAVLAWLIAVGYCHRLTGAMFGLDTTNTMLALYLMLGPAGAVWSVDRWRAKRRAASEGREPPPVVPAVSTNVAIRLLQLHLCVVYLFGGIGKMRGELWWDGSALWYALANYEYQSLAMTWVINSPWLVAALSAVTLFWETFYCFLVWPRLTRPIAIGLAFFIHGGIALFMGMITFGLAMIFANLAFVPPETTKAVVERFFRKPIQPPPAPEIERPREKKPHRRTEAISTRPRTAK